MIRLENIKKEFKIGTSVAHILKGISISIEKGEFVSIMGPSGSGKSTLSSILGCLASPSSGRYMLMNTDIATRSGDDLSRLRNEKIGFIFQDFNLLSGLSALENVMLPLFYSSVSKFNAKKLAMEKIESVGLQKWAYHKPHQLSGGQKQRVAIARALVSNPLFLFADEPTGALDRDTGSEIMGLMQQLNAQGHTIVLVTHSLEHCNYGKRILYLEDGLITRDEVVHNPTFSGAKIIEDKQIFVGTVWDLIIKDPRKHPADFQAILHFFNSIQHDAQNLIYAIQAFSQWDDPEAHKLLQSLAHHEDWSVRAEVLRNVRYMNPKFAESLCVQALHDPNEWVRFLSINHFRFKNFNALNSNIVNLIHRSLEDSDERVRSSTLAVMKAWKKNAPVEKILTKLADSDGRVRANAIEVLEDFLETEINLREVIKQHTQDPHPRARANSLKALFPYEKEFVLSALKVMLAADNSMFRASASWVLKFIDPQLAIPILTERLLLEKEVSIHERLKATLEELLKEPYSLKDLLQSLERVPA